MPSRRSRSAGRSDRDQVREGREDRPRAAPPESSSTKWVIGLGIGAVLFLAVVIGIVVYSNRPGEGSPEPRYRKKRTETPAEKKQPVTGSDRTATGTTGPRTSPPPARTVEERPTAGTPPPAPPAEENPAAARDPSKPPRPDAHLWSDGNWYDFREPSWVRTAAPGGRKKFYEENKDHFIAPGPGKPAP